MQSFDLGFERKPGVPLRLGILPVSVEVLEQILSLPDGYQIVGISFDERQRTLIVVLSSDELPPMQKGQELPTLILLATVDTLPDYPGYRRITAKIEQV